MKTSFALLTLVALSLSCNTMKEEPASVKTGPGPTLACSPSQVQLESSPTQITRFSGEKIRQASDQVMNSFYQNPKAASLPPYEMLKLGEMKGYDRVRNEVSKGMNAFVVNLIEARQSQYYIRCSSKGPQRLSACKELCDTPPAYIWGGMGTYTPRGTDGIELNLYRNFDSTNILTKLPGLDCSGLVHSIFATAGLRVNRDLNKAISAEVADNTPARSYLNTDNETSCFTEVKPLKTELRPGDLLAWKTHILLIDSIGKDPFGIEHIQRPEDCLIENIRPSQASLVGMNSKGGYDFPSAEVEARFLVNADYAKAFYQIALMHNQYVNSQKADGRGLNLQTLPPERISALRARVNPSDAEAIQRRVEKNNLQLSSVGVGISKMYFGELMYSGPQPLFDLAMRACRAKFNIREAANQDPFKPKIVRHLASEGRAPCSCIGGDSERVRLLPKIDDKTAADYCK